MRWRGWLLALGTVVALGAIAVAVDVLHLPDPAVSPAIAARQPDVAHGEYVARLGDCTACHTAPGGKPFAGGLPFATPVGTVYSTNVTPDQHTGIGRYTFPDFARLMRLGVLPNGTRIYPAMPYTAFVKVSDEDLQDLFAWMQKGIAPVDQANRPSTAVWPFSMRWPLALWDAAFLDTSRFASDPGKGDAWNHGAYLVQGFAHCGTCHTPRGIFLQEANVDGRSDLFLSGTSLAAGSPINLRSNDGDGLGRWSEGDVATLLKAGRSTYTAVSGQMGEVVQHSTQFLADADLKAIAVYLKSLPPAPESGRARFAPDETSYKTIMAGGEHSAGGRMFMDSCAACHRLSGSGETTAFPRLAGNASVLSENPNSLIAVIVGGARLPSTAGAPTGLAMPPFGWRYDDEAVAQLATFVRTNWGNHASPVTAAQVATVRKELNSINPVKPVPNG